jgi:beta-glucosidase
MGDSAPSVAPSDIAKADVAKLVDNLTTAEAISLTAGVGFWHTHEVPRLGIPAIKVCKSKKMDLIFRSIIRLRK